ncbi:MAG TPA: hypothetical protein VH189_09290 [Rhizomicrobium sp.]|jgi:hypothetical protein|nr:hypothetical protein [Rhizomicrobium sp.]
MTILEQLWALFLLGGAAAMALFTLQTWSRGWIRNEEDNETITRKDHPRSFAFLQLLQVLGVAILLYAGLQALHGWK